MVGFAFAIVIVVVMLLSLCGESILGAIGNSRARSYQMIKDGFLQTTAPSAAVLKEAQENDDYSDIVDDLSYIMGRTVTAKETEFFTRNHFNMVADLRWEHVTLMLRLSKLGKYPNGYFETSGIMTSKGTKAHEQAKRVYEVVARNLNNNGISTSVIEKTDDRWNRVTINLRQFCFNNFEYERRR